MIHKSQYLHIQGYKNHSSLRILKSLYSFRMSFCIQESPCSDKIHHSHIPRQMSRCRSGKIQNHQNQNYNIRSCLDILQSFYIFFPSCLNSKTIYRFCYNCLVFLKFFKDNIEPLILKSPVGHALQFTLPSSPNCKQLAVISDNSCLLLPGHNSFKVLYPFSVFISGTPSFLGTKTINILRQEKVSHPRMNARNSTIHIFVEKTFTWYSVDGVGIFFQKLLPILNVHL